MYTKIYMEQDWRKLNYHELIEEGIKATRIQYPYGGGFFTPKLKGINHVTLGDSRMIHNPFVILLEWLYVQYEKLRDWLSGFLKSLFPRGEKVYGTKKDMTLIGRVTYASRYDFNKPIHNIYMEFWARKWFGQWRKIGETYSDKDGNFEIKFDFRYAKSSSNRKLYLDIYQVTEVFHEGEKPHLKKDVFKRVEVDKGELIGMRYNLRDIQLFFWEYRHDSPTPRVAIKDHDIDSPQYYSKGRNDAFVGQVIPIEITRVEHLAKIKVDPESLTIKELNDDYPINLTRWLEERYPGFTRSDEYFGTRMMNGMNRGAFLPDKKNPDHYWIKYFGIYGYEKDTIHALPTCEMKFELDGHGYPIPIEIHLTGPLSKFEKDPFVKKVVKRGDGPEWEAAKRLARCCGSFTTEVDEHFTGTHLLTEQFAVAAYRNLRRNPLAFLLFPHLKEVVLINHTADGFLLTDFIPNASAITLNGMLDRSVDILGTQDWKNWKPMEPISEVHTCAKADKLFWDVTSDYVEWFFREHEEGIKEHWMEVHKFSEDLVNHSVKVFASDIDRSKLTDQELKLLEDKLEYYKLRYGFDSTVNREMRNGELKAVSPLTKEESFKEGMEEDLENVRSFCKYAIMVATYMHTWINEHQYDELGEVLYNCGGLRFGDKETGVLGPESDMSIAPALDTATNGLMFANILSRTEYGFIVNNEEGDVHPEYIRLLEEKRKEFEALNVDINTIESRTNI